MGPSRLRWVLRRSNSTVQLFNQSTEEARLLRCRASCGLDLQSSGVKIEDQFRMTEKYQKIHWNWTSMAEKYQKYINGTTNTDFRTTLHDIISKDPACRILLHIRETSTSRVTLILCGDNPSSISSLECPASAKALASTAPVELEAIL